MAYFRCGGSNENLLCIEKEYDSTATYGVDNTVMYGGELYICLEDGVTGEWDSSKWQRIYLDELGEKNSNSKSNEITDDFSIRNGVYAFYGYSANYEYVVFDVTNFDNVTITINNSNALAYITSYFNVYVDDVKQTLLNNVSIIELDVSKNSKLKMHVTYANGTEGFAFFTGTVKRY